MEGEEEQGMAWIRVTEAGPLWKPVGAPPSSSSGKRPIPLTLEQDQCTEDPVRVQPEAPAGGRGCNRPTPVMQRWCFDPTQGGQKRGDAHSSLQGCVGSGPRCPASSGPPLSGQSPFCHSGRSLPSVQVSLQQEAGGWDLAPLKARHPTLRQGWGGSQPEPSLPSPAPPPAMA